MMKDKKIKRKVARVEKAVEIIKRFETALELFLPEAQLILLSRIQLYQKIIDSEEGQTKITRDDLELAKRRLIIAINLKEKSKKLWSEDARTIIENEMELIINYTESNLNKWHDQRETMELIEEIEAGIVNDFLTKEFLGLY